MKNLKNAILLLFCTILAATTLTSCLSDDKDNNDSNIITLSGAQRQQTLLSLAGDYSGYLYFYNNSKKDSVEVDWKVSSTDSTFTCFSFPISFLKYYVTTNSNIKEAVTNAGGQTLIGAVNTYAQAAKTYWEQNHYLYLMTPANKTLKFNYNGKDCQITFDDYQTSSYGYIYPQIQYYNKKSSINFLIKSIKVGDDQLDINTAFRAVGTSCLSDDKDNNDSNIITLSGAQRQQTLLSLAGDYSGHLYFYNNSKKDSVEVDWNVSSTDSTFTCFSFPISFLKYYVTTNSNIKEAVTNAGGQTLKGAVNTYAQAAKTYWEQNYYFYLMTPANKTLEFNYNGKDCQITFDDYQTSSYGYIYPQIQYYNKKSSINLLIKSIKVGDDQLDINTAFQAVGSRQ